MSPGCGTKRPNARPSSVAPGIAQPSSSGGAGGSVDEQVATSDDFTLE
jgi:hypothetical protein